MNQTVKHMGNYWIASEDLPMPANLKVIRRNNPEYGISEDEIQDRYEFIKCYFMKKFQTLMMIPKQDLTNDFFVIDVDVSHHEDSAFNTHAFQKTVRPFNKYNYRMKKILERVKDLAVTHSCISQLENQKLVYEKFKKFMAYQFIDEIEELAKKLHT